MHDYQDRHHSSHLLTKSTFLRGLQCPKSLMLDALQPELRTPLDSHAQMRMRLGQEVGLLARQRYPDGLISRIPGAIEPSLQRTQEYIEGRAQVLYEPAFQYDGVFILVDVLVKGESGWHLIEVKSTSQVKDQHHWDLAVQAFVLRGAGMDLEEATLLHMNTDYIRQGELDLAELFTEASLLNEVDHLQPQVKESVAESKRFLTLGEIPERDIGTHCTDPEICDFKDYCWAGLPSPSVFDVYRLTSKKKHGLYQEGVVRIEDIPPTFPMSASSQFHVEAHKASEEILRREDLATFLEALTYPLLYLDFETFSVPIPPYDDLKPYSNVPFQYSLHIQAEPGGAVEHSGFLAQAGKDPRQDFIEQLLAETEGPGDIIVYNASFERGALKALMEQFPEYAQVLEARIDRLVDLMVPLRDRLYWTPMMGGSVSLKSVLPALVPELSYDALDVQHGMQAMDVFLKLADLGESGAAKEQRKALWEYCKLDTLAMVRILDALRELLQRSIQR
jgi:hypothetical protein